MLVLSRRPGQRILFPHLDISVEVLPGKGSAVRLGIEAPVNVSVMRAELVNRPYVPTAAPQPDSKSRHDLCGRMNTLAIALQLVERQLDAGLTADARQTLSRAQSVLEVIGADSAEPVLAPPPKRVEALLVEDDANEQALLASYLQMSGYNVVTVQDGHEALAFLASHERPDFVLLDMRLPRCDGPTTVEAIRSTPSNRDLRIFAVTGSSPSEFNLPTGDRGVNAWFQKPLNPKRLVEAMSEAAIRN